MTPFSHSLGQSRRFRDAPTISGVPQSTDIAGGRRQVGFVPIAEVGFGQDSGRTNTGVQPVDGTKHFRDAVNAGAEPELFRSHENTGAASDAEMQKGIT
jgi:hypothetical protein